MIQPPTMQSVDSSQLAEMGYDELHARLWVRFHPSKAQLAAGEAGSLYEYSDVPLSVWQGLNVPGVSVGSTFIRTVKSAGYAFMKH